MKAHLIYSMVAVGMLFASCANEEPAPNMKADEGIQPVTRALSSATFRKSPIAMVYIEVNDTNPLNAAPRFSTSRASSQRTSAASMDSPYCTSTRT